MAYRDRVRDEAIAAAKAFAHPEVEPRHLLWGLVQVLDSSTPASVPRAAVRALLPPRGAATAVPTVPAAIEERLKRVTSQVTAIEACVALGAELLGGEGPGPGTTGSPEAATGEGVATRAAALTEGVEPGVAPTARTDSVPALLAELDGLVGLRQVKAAVRRLIAVQRVNAERKAQGLPEVDSSLHVVFTGPPGTGKTTVARLLGRLYGAIGVVSKGHLVEASRPDLVAGYVGQTALKVQAMVQRALGGVLFIDEAYALAQGGDEDFGEEAIATLVKLMEDHRDDLAVIVAGYPAEMHRFIDSNPGLRSRFTHYVDFPDYSADELVEIFRGIAAEARVELAPDLLVALPGLVRQAKDGANFGNARFVRSVFEQGYANMAERAVADDRIDPTEISLMIAADLPRPGEPRWTETRRRIGFRPPTGT
jgi:Holliday junction resolvasome RuvABC ATP-dependent DNA helicase subunit